MKVEHSTNTVVVENPEEAYAEWERGRRGTYLGKATEYVMAAIILAELGCIGYFTLNEVIVAVQNLIDKLD